MRPHTCKLKSVCRVREKHNSLPRRDPEIVWVWCLYELLEWIPNIVPCDSRGIWPSDFGMETNPKYAWDVSGSCATNWCIGTGRA